MTRWQRADEHAVVIAGGGPTGLMLAAELALADVDVMVIERRTSQELDGSRAGGLHARTIEVLDQRGVADRFLAAGEVMQTNGFAYIPLDLSDFPTRHPYGLALWQREIERLLAEWVEELAVPIRRGHEVVGFAEDDDGVSVDVSSGAPLRAQYLVGCDGGRSTVRKAAGIDFAGLAATTSWMIGQVEFDAPPELGFRRDAIGLHAIGPRGPDEPFGVVLTERDVEHAREPDVDDLRAALTEVYGTDFGLRQAHSVSRFTDMTRQATDYRRGRVLLAGDAAHIHPPHGGQGLNTGVQDAVNLGWKLARVVQGTAADELLDTYHAERHPIGARVLDLTRAQVALAKTDPHHQALHAIVTDLLSTDRPRRQLAGLMSALAVHYDLGEGHPLVGRRMPDLDLTTSEGPTSAYELLHDAQPVLLVREGAGACDPTPLVEHVRVVSATWDGPWELPVLGAVADPGAVLIRPDGHVAWTGSPGDASLVAALARWFAPGATGIDQSSLI